MMRTTGAPRIASCWRQAGCLALWAGLLVALLRPLPGWADTIQPAATGPRVTDALFLDATRAGDRLVTIGEWGIVLYSDDEGLTWKQAAVPVDITLTSVVFADEKRGWITGHDAVILATVDGGETWSLQHRDPDLDVPLLNLWFADAQRGIAVGGRGNLFRTADGGQTWEHQALLTAEEFDGHLFAVGRAESGSLFLPSEKGVVYRSDDAGASWRELQAPYNGSLFGVVFPGAGRVVAFAMLGNVAISDDNGETWRMGETGTDKSFMSGQVMADGAVLLAGLDGAIMASRDRAENFMSHALGDRMKIARLLPTRDGQWLAFGEGGIRRITLNLR